MVEFVSECWAGVPSQQPRWYTQDCIGRICSDMYNSCLCSCVFPICWCSQWKLWRRRNRCADGSHTWAQRSMKRTASAAIRFVLQNIPLQSGNIASTKLMTSLQCKNCHKVMWWTLTKYSLLICFNETSGTANSTFEMKDAVESGDNSLIAGTDDNIT